MAGQDYLTLSRSARYAGAEEGQTRITKRYGMAKSNRGNIKARKSDDEFLRRGSYKKINDCKGTMDCEEVGTQLRFLRRDQGFRGGKELLFLRRDQG